MPASSITMPHHTSRLTLSEIVDGTLNLVSQTLGARLTMLTRIDGNTSTISGVVDRLDTIQPGTVFSLDDTFCLQMLRTGQNRITNTDAASAAIRRIPAALELDVRSYAGVPIRLEDGQIFGTLCSADSCPREWTAQEIRTLVLLARLLGCVVDADLQTRHREHNQQSCADQQTTDRLTGLIDRAAFENQLRVEEQRLGRYGGVYSVAVLELDHPACIGMSEGRTVTDQLLEGLANTLMLSSRLLDCCARLEGGRFAVLFPETPSQNVPAWWRRIEAALDTWNLLHAALGAELSFWIGVADSEEADDYQAILALGTQRLLADQAHRAAGRHEPTSNM